MKERKEEPWKEEMEQWRRKEDDPDTFIPVIRLSAVREREVRYSGRKVTTVERQRSLDGFFWTMRTGNVLWCAAWIQE